SDIGGHLQSFCKSASLLPSIGRRDARERLFRTFNGFLTASGHVPLHSNFRGGKVAPRQCPRGGESDRHVAAERGGSDASAQPSLQHLSGGVPADCLARSERKRS